MAFAKWASSELPLEAMWEAALRPARSPFGLIGHDLFEWCADEFAPYPGSDRIAIGRIAPRLVGDAHASRRRDSRLRCHRRHAAWRGSETAAARHDVQAGAAMTLAESFTAHLRRPDRLRRDLTGQLDHAGLGLEARAYDAWCSAQSELAADGPWWGKRITIAPTPPSASPGDLWFDICELALMVHGGRAWLGTRPTARWQMSGFLDVAVREPRPVQVAPPYRALDPARIVAGPELARCTRLTAGEATLYAWWFGKMLPHLFDWQSAQEVLAGALMRELWQTSSREWTSTRLDEDEAARIFVTPATIDWDPSEVLESEEALPEARRGMIRGELTREPEIGFRTAVLLQFGLHETVSASGSIAEDVRLASLLDRRPFR